MKRAIISIILLSGIPIASADTIHVTVGDTGCAGRQIGVTKCWEKIPGVVSVTVLPRKSGDQTAQRVFVIVSSSAAPTEDTLQQALGRRDKRYPILAYESSSNPDDTARK